MPGSSTSKEPARTTSAPARSIPSAWPRSTSQESAKSQMPYVGRSPGLAPCCRQGHTASQLQASKYVPDTAHVAGGTDRLNQPPPPGLEVENGPTTHPGSPE